MEEVENAKREAKHVQLHQAIEQLSATIALLESIIDRIKGILPEQPKDSGEREGIPTLSDILETGPQRIREQSNRLEDIREKLTELLF